MKTLTVSVREERRAKDIISDIKVLDDMLEQTCSNEWLLRTEDEDEEEMIIDTIRQYFSLIGIMDDEYEMCER